MDNKSEMQRIREAAESAALDSKRCREILEALFPKVTQSESNRLNARQRVTNRR
jgi:ethanolamine utilization protein EutQ (cupin superfamily)